MTNTVMAFRIGILAWYDDRLSTTKVEGFNNKIRVMKRNAYGFRDNEYFKPKYVIRTQYGLWCLFCSCGNLLTGSGHLAASSNDIFGLNSDCSHYTIAISRRMLSDGTTDFGEITAETGLTPAPIRLKEGEAPNKKAGKGYGLLHIEARHGDEIRRAGFTSVQEFVEYVAKKYNRIQEGNVNRLTSSSCHPEVLVKEFSDTLMPFHEHCFADGFLVFGQLELDGGYCLGERKRLVHTKPDTRQFQYALEFLVHLQGNEAYTHMRLYPPAGEVEHRAYFYL